MIQNNKKVLGVILAGGLSRRMNGENKFLKMIQGKTLIGIIVSKALMQVNKLIINANIVEKKIQQYNLPIIKDSLSGFFGPLAGILAAMEYANKKKIKWLLTVPCDAPFFPKDLTKKLLSHAIKRKKDIVIAKSGGRNHPVFGIWSTSLTKSLKTALKKKQIRKMDVWIEEHNFSVVNFVYDKIDPFFNINDQKDLKRANKIYKNVKSIK